jgi:hypothetical protein
MPEPTQNPSADRRRYLLIEWIEECPAHDGLTASEIADVSGIYDHIQHGRADRCHDDLKALAAVGVSRLRREGRPARWFATGPFEWRAVGSDRAAGEVSYERQDWTASRAAAVDFRADLDASDPPYSETWIERRSVVDENTEVPA